VSAILPELGAVDYVAKSFNPHELLARIHTHLTMDELRRSLAGKDAELARAHELVRRAFGRYVSEEVATSILQLELHDIGGIGEPFNLSLPSWPQVLCPLPQLLPIRFTVLEDSSDAPFTKAIGGRCRTWRPPFSLPLPWPH
jgi:hypothetical protein